MRARCASSSAATVFVWSDLIITFPADVDAKIFASSTPSVPFVNAIMLIPNRFPLRSFGGAQYFIWVSPFWRTLLDVTGITFVVAVQVSAFTFVLPHSGRLEWRIWRWAGRFRKTSPFPSWKRQGCSLSLVFSILNEIHFFLDYLGIDGWSKRTGSVSQSISQTSQSVSRGSRWVIPARGFLKCF